MSAVAAAAHKSPSASAALVHFYPNTFAMLPPAPAEGSHDVHSSRKCSFSLRWYTSTKFKCGCHHEQWTLKIRGVSCILLQTGTAFLAMLYILLHFASFPAYLTIFYSRSAPAAGHHSWPSVRRQWWSWPGGDSRTLVLSSTHTVDTWLSWPALGNILQTPANFCFIKHIMQNI